MTRLNRLLGWIVFGVVLSAGLIGCKPKGYNQAEPDAAVPAPISLMLPKTLEIHSFTRTGVFEQGGRGVHARVQARDAYGDPTKAFGDLRFELYEFRRHHQGKKGVRLADWEVRISQPAQNLTHWDRHTRSYQFKLNYDQPLPTGRRYIFVAVFSSKFTPRLLAERELIAGE